MASSSSSSSLSHTHTDPWWICPSPSLPRRSAATTTGLDLGGVRSLNLTCLHMGRLQPVASHVLGLNLTAAVHAGSLGWLWQAHNTPNLVGGSPDERWRTHANPTIIDGLAGPWMGLVDLPIDFSFFLFYLINQGGRFKRLGKDLFTMTFRLRRLGCLSRLIYFFCLG
jgi:hypothetical protein